MRYLLKRSRVCIALVVFFILVATIVVASAAESSPLQLTAYLNKQSYLEGEPIIIMLALTNMGQKQLTVAEPLVREGFVKIMLTTAEGNEVDAPRLVRDIALPPQDYGVCIDPGASLEISWSMNESYGYGLKPGLYQVVLMYDTAKHANNYPRIWHGTIAGPKLVCSIEAPVEMEKKAYELLKEGRDTLLRREEINYDKSRKVLLDLITRYPQSVYSPYAHYLLGKSYSVRQADKTQHFVEAVREFQNFLKKFPDYPYYSYMVTVSELPYSLLQAGQGELAREILKKAPGGYYKQRMLRQIDGKATK